jgi:4-hydroxy-tetrahydrodipicolinate reductase
MSEPKAAALFGAAGRMGREILKQAWRTDEIRIALGYDLTQAGEIIETVTILTPPEQLPPEVRVLLDFSTAEAVLEHLNLALNAGCAYVCGVTGLPDEVMNELRASANEIPVLYAANFSQGMTVMTMLAKTAASTLRGYERHIVEIHHAEKKDVPSGTALHLAQAVAEAAGGETEITAVRMGDVTGEHRIIFGGPGERLEIIHRADSRAVFAVGALRAAAWIAKKSPGFYKMADVVEENDKR